MAKTMSYDADEISTVISDLKKVNTSLTELQSAIVAYQKTYDGVSAKIDPKIKRMSEKINENDEIEIDYNDYNYYTGHYGNPLRNAMDNIELLKAEIPGIVSRVDVVNESFTTVQSLVSLYEEIPPVKDDDLDEFDIGINNSGSGFADNTVIPSTGGYSSADINIDLNGDGVPDLNIDTNGDGKADLNIDLNMDGVPDLNIDTNGDGKADLNIDTNGDGKADLNIDKDGDGKADLNIDINKDGNADQNVDKDGDGKADLNIDKDKDGNPDVNRDVDGDGKADVNIDINEDGNPDINIDINGDGIADINIDINGDGIGDINIDVDGDGKADLNIDTNGDGKADLNIDTNGDGIADKNIDANGDGIIDSIVPDNRQPAGPGVPPKHPEPSIEGEKEPEVLPPPIQEDKTDEENAEELINIGKVIIPDISGEDGTHRIPEDANKDAEAVSNIGAAIAGSVGGITGDAVDAIVEEKPSIPDALLGGNASNGISEFGASGSYKNAQGPAAQAGVGLAGLAALGVAVASGGTAISGVIEEKNEDPSTKLGDDELAKRKRIRTLITSGSLILLSVGFIITQILRPGFVITILLFAIAILVSAIASIFGTNVGKTITTLTSLLLLLVTFLLSAFNVVSPLGYIISLIVLLTVFLIVYTFDLFKEFVDNKVMIPSFVVIVTLNAFGLLKVFEIVNWLIYLLLAGLGIAVYLWYERYYGQGFEVINRLKNVDKRRFFN